jgi:pimeloyl-ACP methyl ester carboxylesterase
VPPGWINWRNRGLILGGLTCWVTVSLIGYSWGTGLAPATLGSYRAVDAQAASAHWSLGLSQAEIGRIAPRSRVEPWYAPQKILSPALIVVGEWDRETTPEQCQTVFSQLDNVPLKRLTMIGGSTHSMFLENHRHELHAVVSDFLKE